MSDYPRALYSKSGGFTVARDEAHEKELGKEWGREPYPVHRGDAVPNPPVDGTAGDDAVRRVVREELAAYFAEQEGEDDDEGAGPGAEGSGDALNIPRRRGRPRKPASTSTEQE